MARKSLTEILNGKTVFGDYEVLGDGRYSEKCRFAFCRCKCGTEKDVETSKLLSGRSTCCKSCAKTSPKRVTSVTHGMSRSSEYGIYKGIIARCLKEGSHRYESYGARGIGVDARWVDSFDSFYEDMGKRPSSKHSIDRIDNSRGYFRDNCRWALPVEQMSNRDCTLKVEYRGSLCAVSVLANDHGIAPATLSMRLKLGWDIESALSKPVENRKPLHNVNGRMMKASEIESEYGVSRWHFNNRLRKGMSVMEAIALG